MTLRRTEWWIEEHDDGWWLVPVRLSGHVPAQDALLTSWRCYGTRRGPYRTRLDAVRARVQIIAEQVTP